MTAARPEFTVIDDPAASKDLTVKATVKTELGITGTDNDAQIDTNIHQASALIAGHVGRDLAEDQRTDHFRIDGRDAIDVLRLSHWPVSSIDAITEAGIALDEYDYELDILTGRMWRLDAAGDRIEWTAGKITVQHTSGYALLTNLPHDLERACIEQVKAVFSGRQRDPTLKSESVPDVYQASYALAGGDFIGTSGLLKSVEGALVPYRKPGLA
jgi:hypothetical protein